MAVDNVARGMAAAAMSGGGGGGGSSALSGLTDVDISNPTNGQTLVYNATSGKWENGDSAGGRVLVVPVTLSDENLLVSTKTWQEIYDAEIPIFKNTGDGRAYFYITDIFHFGADYTVIAIGPDGNLTFTCASANGYPTAEN